MTDSRCARFRWLGLAAPGLAWVIFTLCGVMLVGGCRLCADGDDHAYPSYGGAWQRTHRDSGRVGSIFDPGGSRASDLSERAQSDSPDVTNRSTMGAGNGGAGPDQDASGPVQDEQRDAMDTDGVEPPSSQGEEDLRELEQRYQDLQLEEINHNGPPINAGRWQ